MKIKSKSALFGALNNDSGKLIPYIKKFLAIHPYAGRYEVFDEPYVSNNQNVETKRFHPSGDCLKCQRLMYWERDPEHFKDVEEEPSVELQAIFKLGSTIHAMIQAWFSAMSELDGFPKCIANEQRIQDDDYNIGGYIDSVLLFPGETIPVPIEIKSSSDYVFSRLNEPLPAHKLQVSCYMMELNAPYGVVLYYNKNTSEMKEFVVEPIDMMPTLMSWSKVRLAVASKDISMLDHGCRLGSKEWEKCPAHRFCKAE